MPTIHSPAAPSGVAHFPFRGSLQVTVNTNQPFLSSRPSPLPFFSPMNSTSSPLDVLEGACCKLRAWQAPTCNTNVTLDMGAEQLLASSIYAPPPPFGRRRRSACARLVSVPEIRTKSGELVKPSLKMPRRRSDNFGATTEGEPYEYDRSKSYCSTQAAIKAVHFNANLEQIRLFRSCSCPSAVGNNNSDLWVRTTADEEDSEGTDVPVLRIKPGLRQEVGFRAGSSRTTTIFASELNYSCASALHPAKKSVRLQLRLPKYRTTFCGLPSDPPRTIFLESIHLSDDRRSVQGAAQVDNLNFEKWVAVRYTMDDWTTVREVSASHIESIIQGSKDRFGFTIRLDELLNQMQGTEEEAAQAHSIHLCLRYSTAQQEFWDNNGGHNYQLDLFVPAPSTSASSVNPVVDEPVCTRTFAFSSTNNTDLVHMPAPALSAHQNCLQQRRNHVAPKLGPRGSLSLSPNLTVLSDFRADNWPSTCPATDYFGPMHSPYYSGTASRQFVSGSCYTATSLQSPVRSENVGISVAQLDDHIRSSTSSNKVWSWNSGMMYEQTPVGPVSPPSNCPFYSLDRKCLHFWRETLVQRIMTLDVAQPDQEFWSSHVLCKRGCC